jgi:hypothetical protein
VIDPPLSLTGEGFSLIGKDRNFEERFGSELRVLFALYTQPIRIEGYNMNEFILMF